MTKGSPIQPHATGGGNDSDINEPTRMCDNLHKSKTKGLKNKVSNQSLGAQVPQLSELQDATIKDHAPVVLQEIDLKDISTPAASYSLESRLPLPEPSPLLIRAREVQCLENELRRVRFQRLEEARQGVYIPPMAKANLQASDSDLFPLMDKVQKFLTGERQVMLILGDSGAGKSTFNKHLEVELLQSYTIGGCIPLFINLPAIYQPVKEMMTEQLEGHGFSDSQIQEMKQHRRFIVICDAYDESQLTTNLHTSNLFNRPGQWKVKLVITCRTQYLGPNYRNHFVPQGGDHYDHPAPDLFDEAVIAPFSKKQIESYVEQYVPLEPRPWVKKDYMERLTTIPNLMELVRNPFLLSLALEALPGITNGKLELSKIKITRVQLYDTFVEHWFGVNKRRIESNALSVDDRIVFDLLLDAGFVTMGIDYSTRLASAIFHNQDGHPLVQYIPPKNETSWKEEFFGDDVQSRLLRESSPLSCIGNQHRFLHRSMLEYFFSRTIYNPVNAEEEELYPKSDTPLSTSLLPDANSPLFLRNLVPELSIIQFLCDRVKSTSDFKPQLLAVIDQSKTDAKATIAATNAVTILVRAEVSLNGADLRGVRIPGADLSGGLFDFAQFQGADLRRANLSRCWLRQADMSSARMEDVQFGELPYLKVNRLVESCAYSPDGKMFALGTTKDGCGICIYDTSIWAEIRRIGGSARVLDVAFSPNGQSIVSAGYDGTVRLWDCTDSQEMFVMEGHSGPVRSVAFSPCGKQIASASNDKTVRLWDSQTGQNLFILEGHNKVVASVKYSPNGERLVSGSWDETIRFWDAVTGEPGVVLETSLGVHCLAYSPDGQWIVSGHSSGDLKLWNTVTSEPGPLLLGHTGGVNDVAFSPNSQLIASASGDKLVRLWDTMTGILVSTIPSHSGSVICIAFSPDGHQIASVGHYGKLRLRETTFSTSDSELQFHLGSVWRAAYSPDGLSILSVSDDRTIRQWDSLTGEPGSMSLKHPKSFSRQSVIISPDGKQIAAFHKDNSIRLWSLQTGAAGPILEGPEGILNSMAFLPCSRRLVSYGFNHDVLLWDLDNTEQHQVLFDSNVGVFYATVSSDGLYIALCCTDKTVRLLNCPSGEFLSSIKSEGDDFRVVAFSTAGQQLAIGTHLGSIKLWNLQPDDLFVGLEGHKSGINSITYSPCDEWIISSCDDMIVILWRRQHQFNETERWACVSIVRGFFDHIRDIDWNPVVPLEFITACMDGSIRVWRVSISDGGVVVKLLWGSYLRSLCAADTILEGVTGLSPTNKKLMTQSGAIFHVHKQDD